MIEPYRREQLAVDDENLLYYECSGNPDGWPVLALHGGPGAGWGSGYHQWIDPEKQLIIGFDQRGCGRSTPLASERLDLLDANTTTNQVADIELLRRHLGIQRWTVTGGSWGTTLALSYAQAHPDRVDSMVLAAITTTSSDDVRWITEEMGRLFPEQWERFAGAVTRHRGEQVVEAYARVLRHGTADERAAAAEEWCRWEDTHVSLNPGWQPSERYKDPQFQLVFATLVTHYWANAGFGGDTILERMDRIGHIPTALFHGRYDISSQSVTPWRLASRWPAAELHFTADGHGGPEMTHAMSRAVRALPSQHR